MSGFAFPYFNLLFGELMDALNNPDPDIMRKEFDRIVIAFLVIAAVSFVTGWIQVTCWAMAGMGCVIDR